MIAQAVSLRTWDRSTLIMLTSEQARKFKVSDDAEPESEKQKRSRLTVSGSVYDGPEENRIGELTMKPNVFVERDQQA